LGASYFGDKQYAVEYADVVTQSYHPVKHITTGEGGVVLTNNPEIDKKVKLLRNHGMTKNLDQMENNDGPWYYEIHEVGYNYRITDFQCALGISQLKRLNKFISRRRNIAEQYDIAFGSDERFIIPVVSKNVNHAFHLYPLNLQFEKMNVEKKHLFESMKKNDFILQVHYIPVHLQPYYQNKYGFKVGDFPHAESFYNNEISLPIYPDLSYKECQKIINTISRMAI
jgi:dTDP-4-amino-4,6-dideoxygalactose transaminase